MNNIVVDPVIVLMPDENASKEELESWLSNLQLWLEEVFNSPHQWFHLAEITIRHMGYTSLPNFKTLNAWQNKYSIEIDIPEILTKLSNFFMHEDFELQPKIEKQLLEAGYVVGSKQASIVIHPTQFVERWPIELQADISAILVQICAAKHKQIELATNIFIATQAINISENKIEVSANIAFLSDLEEETEQFITETLPLLFTPEDIELPDIITLWQQGYKGICRIVELQFKKDWSNVVGKPMLFTLGPLFIESVRIWGLHVNPIILQKIVRYTAAVIANQAQNVRGCKLHPLRENEAGNSPQRVRASDGAAAWRLDITKHGAGWRLHYWHISNSDGGAIEFSNICKESDSHIYE